MQSDMANLELPENVKLELPNKEDIMNFFVTVKPRSEARVWRPMWRARRCTHCVRSEGYWKKATFKFKFTVPGDYPYTPPKIVCQDKVPVGTPARLGSPSTRARSMHRSTTRTSTCKARCV